MLYYLASTILLGLTFIFPQQLGFLDFFFFLPILYHLKNKKYSFKYYLLLNTLFAYIFSATYSWWFLSAYPLDWIYIDNSPFSLALVVFIWTCICIAMTIPYIIPATVLYFSKNMSYIKIAFATASAWSIFEYLRSTSIAFAIYGKEVLVAPHHTYGALAYNVSTIPIFNQVIAVGGMYLVTFVIILINFTLFSMIFRKKDERNKFEKSLKIFVLALIFVCYIFMYFIRSGDKTKHEVDFLLGNVKFSAADDFFIETVKDKRVVDKVNEMGIENANVVVPENINIVPRYQADKNLFSKKQNTVIGSGIFSGKEKMYFITPQDSKIDYYQKQLLMPIGEYPVESIRIILKLLGDEKWLTLFNQNVSNIQKGEDRSGMFAYTYNGNDINIVGTLCSENMSPYITNDRIKEGGNLIINIASHAPFHGSKILQRQSVGVNTTRALESGRYYMVSSNYDDSYIINDVGDRTSILKNTDTEKGGVNFGKVKVYLKEYKTPYLIFGDYILFFSVIILIFSFGKPISLSRLYYK